MNGDNATLEILDLTINAMNGDNAILENQHLTRNAVETSILKTDTFFETLVTIPHCLKQAVIWQWINLETRVSMWSGMSTRVWFFSAASAVICFHRSNRLERCCDAGFSLLSRRSSASIASFHLSHQPIINIPTCLHYLRECSGSIWVTYSNTHCHSFRTETDFLRGSFLNS